MGGDATDCVRVPDQIRQDGMGDTARCGGVQASRRATLRGVQALRWHRQNTWDNSGTQLEAVGPGQPDIPEQVVRTPSSRGVTCFMAHCGYFR